jgi:hypothetical protein
MTRTQLINGIINYAFETDTDAKRQGNIIYLNIGEIESGDFIHLDAFVDDRCYQQGATALQPAESGYAVDAVDIRWAAYNDKVFAGVQAVDGHYAGDIGSCAGISDIFIDGIFSKSHQSGTDHFQSDTGGTLRQTL